MLKNHLFKARNLALSMFLLFSVTFLQAQTAADYKITTTVTHATCPTNGTITIKVTNADGSPLDWTAQGIQDIRYEVRDHLD